MINTLRNCHDNKGNIGATSKSAIGEGNDVKSEQNEATKFTETIPNPPAFYEDDMAKWKKKFSKALKDREYTKF